MDHFATKDAMLAILRFQIPVTSERMDRDVIRQSVPKMGAVTTEAGIQDGDFDALPSIAGGMPAQDAQLGQMLQPLLERVRIGGVADSGVASGTEARCSRLRLPARTRAPKPSTEPELAGCTTR